MITSGSPAGMLIVPGGWHITAAALAHWQASCRQTSAARLPGRRQARTSDLSARSTSAAPSAASARPLVFTPSISDRSSSGAQYAAVPMKPGVSAVRSSGPPSSDASGPHAQGEGARHAAPTVRLQPKSPTFKTPPLPASAEHVWAHVRCQLTYAACLHDQRHAACVPAGLQLISACKECKRYA